MDIRFWVLRTTSLRRVSNRLFLSRHVVLVHLNYAHLIDVSTLVKSCIDTYCRFYHFRKLVGSVYEKWKALPTLREYLNVPQTSPHF